MDKNRHKYLLYTLIMTLGLVFNSLGQEINQNNRSIFVKSLGEAKRNHLKVAIIDLVDIANGIPIYKAKLEQLKGEFEPSLNEISKIAEEVNELEDNIKLLEKDSVEYKEMSKKLKSITSLREKKRKDLEEQAFIRKQELFGDIHEKVIFHLKMYLKAHKYDVVYDMSFTKYTPADYKVLKLPIITDNFIKYYNSINAY